MMSKRIFQIGVLLVMPILLALSIWTQPATAITEEQRVVVEAWRIVNRAYLDDTFNHQNWSAVRQQALKQPLDNPESAYTTVEKMLASLKGIPRLRSSIKLLNKVRCALNPCFQDWHLAGPEGWSADCCPIQGRGRCDEWNRSCIFQRYTNNGVLSIELMGWPLCRMWWYTHKPLSDVKCVTSFAQ